MQYIEKLPLEPGEWVGYFTTENRVFNYDNCGGQGKVNARRFLLTEQNGLCAYCQSELTVENSSIEHVIPNSKNKNLSTLYHNLVAVCNDSPVDEKSRKHCDKERGSMLLPPLIFYSNAQVTEASAHGFLVAKVDGSIEPKAGLEPDVKQQVEAFISILQLNHAALVDKRKKGWVGISSILATLPRPRQRAFFQSQLTSILAAKDKPYRQYLAILLRQRLY